MKNYLLYFFASFMLLTANSFAQKYHQQTDPNGDTEILQSKVYHAQNAQTLNRELMPVNPGMDPEGDYLSYSIFSNDGSKVFQANRMTDNISVFDWETMDLITNISVGDYPNALAVTDDYLLVACQFADKLWVVDLSDYSIVDSLETAEQPCRVHVNSDGSKAFVACDIDDICHVVDLQSMTVEMDITGFPIYLQKYSWSAQSSRNYIKYSDFVVSPDNQYLITIDGSDYLQYFNTSTGAIDHEVDMPSGRAVALSGDGSRVIAVALPDGTAKTYQIDLAGATIETEVEISGYGLYTNAVVSNMDGTKAFVGTNNNSSTLVNFDTQDFTNFSQTYSPFWMGVTHDHAYAISGQYRFSILDFETESITDQLFGYNQSFGSVSPVDYHVFSNDPIIYEGAYFFDITDPENIDLRGDMISGEAPEGDAPFRSAFDAASGMGVSVNNLSRNASIINVEDQATEAWVELGEACYDVEMTPDGNWTMAGGYNNNTVKIIDMQNQELATEVATGQRPMEIIMSQDGQHAYAGNIKSNTLSVIELDGANSQVITSEPCGVIGVYTPFFGVRSDIELSADGSLILVAASFDDEVNVFDTQSNEFIASVAMGDFPLSIAMTDDGAYACVSNLFDHNISILEMDAANTSLMTTTELTGDYPVEVEYNPHDGHFYVITYWNSRIHKIDPATGDVVDQMNYSAYGTIFQVEFDETGNPLILSQGDEGTDPQLIYGEYSWSLSGTPSQFEYNEGDLYALVTIPGPDYVDIIDLGVISGTNETIGASGLSLYPNPADDFLLMDAKDVVKKVEVFDMQGRNVKAFKPNNKKLVLNISELPAGNFVLKVQTSKGKMVKKFVKK